jgi:hypothetical protein
VYLESSSISYFYSLLERQFSRTVQTYRKVIHSESVAEVHPLLVAYRRHARGKPMSDEQVVELLQSCVMKPEDITQLEDIKSRMEILSEIEKRLRLIVEELSTR